MKLYSPIFLFFLLLFSCSSESVKEKINKAGDVTGQAIGEFTEGVSSGVEKAFDTKVLIADGLKAQGIECGKTTVSSDSSAADNLLTVYVIFNQDFSGEITAKAFDKVNNEMGRIKLAVNAKKDESRYLEFHFDPHTNIDHDSKLTIE
ncbi:MAG: hypothetical protein IPG90_02110 [Bacteroidetes bacterium]|nr:hypothetical protein [Bacteroidota bacterium]MBP6403305.1 hypothetical protein [Bacteroidia bacterium]MBP6650175.1 hypothetical protein [Bacteroidia bacterium]